MAKKFNNGWKNKIRSGWQKKPDDKINKSKFKHNRLKRLISRKYRHIPLDERIVKSLIWFALRICMWPSQWKNKRKNRETINRAYKRIQSSDFVFIPPAFAFYLIIAFMPVLFLVVIIIGTSPIVAQAFETVLKDILGKQTNIIKDISKFFSKNNIGSILYLVILMLLSTWIASAGFAKFVYTESYVYGHDKMGGFWMNRFRGMVMVAMLTIFLAFAITIYSFIPEAIKMLSLKHSSIGYNLIYWPVLISGTFVGVYILFGALFRYSPRFKLKWKQVHAGAVTSTIPTVLFVLLFTLITKVTLKYSFLGNFASFMTLAMSFFIISYFIYVGLIVNVVYYKAHIGKKTIHKTTVSKK